MLLLRTPNNKEYLHELSTMIYDAKGKAFLQYRVGDDSDGRSGGFDAIVRKAHFFNKEPDWEVLSMALLSPHGALGLEYVDRKVGLMRGRII